MILWRIKIYTRKYTYIKMKVTYAHYVKEKNQSFFMVLIIKLYYNFILNRNNKITKLKFKALFSLPENQTHQILSLNHK